MRKFCWIVILCLSVFACSSPDEEEVKAGKYGMMGSDTPQYAAVIFMRAVYNDKNLDRATKLSTERFARILKGYHTNKNVQRQVFNLRLDDMTTEPISGGALLFSEKQKSADIEMKIIGHYNNKKITELKTISLVKESGDWKVKSVSNTVP
ncbi:hypothetical protein [Glaciecola petra]|uniref:DUF4878 domain-containing protein n=1 Tax=Glaciecola petra TaxID=3075602 RepID=A0ABU2ZSD8_9ALTE|nr:hypothetical protein [Aestuariibacter sp. P117]MDT0594352.1 hypothetical protein [Aestuariibacter sp. P117]